jgi:hypothetical protein
MVGPAVKKHRGAAGCAGSVNPGGDAEAVMLFDVFGFL